MLAEHPDLALVGEKPVEQGRRKQLVATRLRRVVGADIRQHLGGLDQTLVLVDRHDDGRAPTLLLDVLHAQR